MLNFQALNKSKMGTSLCDVTMTLNGNKKLETSFFLNKIHFSTRKCMFDTFTQKFPRDYTAAYSIIIRNLNIYEPRSDRRDLLTIKVESEIFTEKERPSCCEQLQKI